MITCTKVYTDIPFAHRQPNHDGHCADIHGHNWSFHLTFATKTLDENGFVVDFGKLKYIKEWIEKNLDHACVLNITDPCAVELDGSSVAKYFKLFLMPDCSCEGLAKYLFEEFNHLVMIHEKERVTIVEVKVYEDSKNSTTYSK